MKSDSNIEEAKRRVYGECLTSGIAFAAFLVAYSKGKFVGLTSVIRDAKLPRVRPIGPETLILLGDGTIDTTLATIKRGEVELTYNPRLTHNIEATPEATLSYLITTPDILRLVLQANGVKDGPEDAVRPDQPTGRTRRQSVVNR